MRGEISTADAELVQADALLSGGPPPVRDALTLFQALVPLARGDRARAERALADLDRRGDVPVDLALRGEAEPPAIVVHHPRNLERLDASLR